MLIKSIKYVIWLIWALKSTDAWSNIIFGLDELIVSINTFDNFVLKESGNLFDKYALKDNSTMQIMCLPMMTGDQETGEAIKETIIVLKGFVNIELTSNAGISLLASLALQ